MIPKIRLVFTCFSSTHDRIADITYYFDVIFIFFSEIKYNEVGKFTFSSFERPGMPPSVVAFAVFDLIY